MSLWHSGKGHISQIILHFWTELYIHTCIRGMINEGFSRSIPGLLFKQEIFSVHLGDCSKDPYSSMVNSLCFYCSAKCCVQYAFLFQVQIIGTVVYSNYTVAVEVQPTAPVSVIANGHHLFIDKNTVKYFILDGTASFDPDNPGKPLR